MRIGILSDSHGKVDATRAAVALLRSRGAEFLFHCGDIGSEAVVDQLAGEIPAAFVFGNNDYDRDELASYSLSLGVKCLGICGEIELDGKTFAITHGDNPSLVREFISSQTLDYLLLGHTHVTNDRRYDRTRVINPGALYRASVKTVALLDSKDDQLEFLPVPI